MAQPVNINAYWSYNWLFVIMTRQLIAMANVQIWKSNIISKFCCPQARYQLNKAVRVVEYLLELFDKRL